MIRTPAAMLPYIAAVAAVVAGLLWHAGDRIAGLGRTVESGAATIGGPFSLIDQDGQSRAPVDFHGRYMLIYFGYSSCPDVCPTTLTVMADALAKLGARQDRVAPIFISVDPGRDTPAVLKAYLKSFGANFVGLTGSPEHIAQAARAYHVYHRRHALASGGYAVDHSNLIYLMDPDGRFVARYDETIGPDGLAADLKSRL